MTDDTPHPERHNMPKRPGSVLTIMRVIPAVVGEELSLDVHLAARPSLNAIRAAVEPHLDGQRLEHVTVLFEGLRRDMFVGEHSASGIRNVRATAIYHNAALAAIEAGIRTYADYPDPWPAVCGPAVLFPHRQVWF